MNVYQSVIPFVNIIGWSTSKFPVGLNQNRKFERVNLDITVNVYEHAESGM